MIPSAYLSGMGAARQIDPELAELYLTHTQIGDPKADAVIAGFRGVPFRTQMDWFRRGVSEGPEAIPDAPEALREFIRSVEAPPVWFDAARALPGCRVFYGNVETFMAAFAGGVLIQGFSTLISRSFAITGRLIDAGERRLKQNNRHLAEIFLPGGLDTYNDGWKASLRIRLMHASLRSMLQRSPEWDQDAWGMPLSAAHIAFGAAAFSGGLVMAAGKLGLQLTEEERESFMMIWRYSAHLMGVPEALQVATVEEAEALIEVGRAIEPEPDFESIILTNSLINSAPIVAGITHPGMRRRLVRKIYRVSRELIGQPLADQLRFPPERGHLDLALFRLKCRLDRIARRWVPSLDQMRRSGQFSLLMTVSSKDEISFRMPGHLHAEKDRENG